LKTAIVPPGLTGFFLEFSFGAHGNWQVTGSNSCMDDKQSLYLLRNRKAKNSILITGELTYKGFGKPKIKSTSNFLD